MEEERSATGRRRVYHTLDAIRGIAALIVMQRHSGDLLAWLPIPFTYLAVDLFFVLSGFVIAFSYEDRLRQGASPWKFALLRVIRLYPLYLIGIAIGFVLLVKPSGHALPTATIVKATLLAVFMLPPWGVPALCGPRWTLTYELVANFLYAFAIRLMTTGVLIAICTISAATMIGLLARGQVFDTGWAVEDSAFALARVGYSFFVGVICYRLHSGAVSMRRMAPSFAALALAVALSPFVMLGADAFQTLLVILLFPVLVYAAALYDVPPGWAKPCAFLGVASYAIYVIHEPASRMLIGILKRLGVGAENMVPAGIVFVGAMVGISWVIDRYYDKPVRKWLTDKVGRLGPPQRPAMEAVTEVDRRVPIG